MTEKVIIIAPFWGQKGHVGVYRIDRFVRWLSDAGMQIVLVKAGGANIKTTTNWGIEISIRDPLGLYHYKDQENNAAISPRKPNKLRRMLAYLLFNPDPSVVWARHAAKHPIVLKYAKGARWVLSTNPPESSHVGASILAKRLQAKLIIDMRDGWLDEPLQALLQSSKIQRWREGRLEKRILRQAEHIFVTSIVWQSLLANRLPFSKDKITVLTNGYPLLVNHLPKQPKQQAHDKIHLLHAGRFTGSSLSRKVNYLLNPILNSINDVQFMGIITLLGDLNATDFIEINALKPRFELAGWRIEVKASVPRNQMMTSLSQADGLLLLSVSHAAIPSKIFEYIPSAKPILAVTPKNSAVWQFAKHIPQLFTVDVTMPDREVLHSFIISCSSKNYRYSIPDEFDEKHLSKIFLKGFER